ncbi:PTS IIA-like nitrogen regulatory protein PtsN [Sulfuriferula nivalis]|uniref:PTS IIA-like nitrogen-regulatory protein PtsN n=1 Tax=Sulfuriferula nivalis TaxID=2675298 RepID=A0A809RTL1_9PROT|nr:PTS IIA-like nitrogen regulatory protein PtsN [Sulfuriferula nivalis]BBP02231.1 PTS IIA-like nitrogen-regulatory protein PtsN [Sulfuriferula nivalis]
MNQLASLLSVTRILLDVEAESKKQLFEQVGQLLHAESCISEKTVLDSLLAREKLGSTGLGLGVAMPHGRIKGLKSASGVFVRLRNPIEFDAPDHLPVRLLFILFVPAQATDLHLEILSELAQFFSSKTVRDALCLSESAEDALAIIRNWTP